MSDVNEPQVPEPPDASSDPENSFGFENGPPRQKYNTDYLVTHMRNDERKNRLLMLGAIVAVVAGCVIWFWLSSTG